MPNYQVKFETIQVGNAIFEIRTLANQYQYPEADRAPEKDGISAALWPYFGVIWPSGRMLADTMSWFPIAGKKILEIGSGIALASMVVHQRGGDIIVSDYNPMVEVFLLENIALNHLPPLPFQLSDWAKANPLLGKFDLIIGSDILYERDHPQLLAAFIECHANAQMEVIIVDPGRKHHRKFSREMGDRGYLCAEETLQNTNPDGTTYRGRLLTYQRHDPITDFA
ncbi:hypothetical protein BST81_10135 [Leptolyngbya sp. 'hensonii']|uniref:class I SAM-dependent methyltransferase n=1 Tax=Leptolyngbya sp. 'hensonii' TaxID=1922337 RepID=UPI000950169E|nr:hypothetical protein [Leptolyngbya sp. 'hensonii']OLP18634.1 hypothetical protein BST81_10135 [Leptolyngbya sp. 'hensonii']